jgi:8-oxo-dGTP pyrophosphatase MutT (NUDIX family)
MLREFSAGGVVVHAISGVWHIAVIEPQHENLGDPVLPEPAPTGVAKSTAKSRRKPSVRKPVLALPKGLIDQGEKPADAALREVHEETGITASLITKISDIKYVYIRSWGDQQKVFKVVSFYLLRYESGQIDNVSPDMRIEVRQARWLPLDEAPAKLAYGGERQVVRQVQQYLKAHPNL